MAPDFLGAIFTIIVCCSVSEQNWLPFIDAVITRHHHRVPYAV